jgi:hypothetical protein
VGTRCPRCKEHELALETFGVFRCAKCGRMSIDGAPIADGATEAPAVVTTGSASFAAPPRGSAPPTREREPLPRIVFTLVALEAILCVTKATLPDVSLARIGIRASALVAVLIGTKGSYRYATGALGSVFAIDLLNLASWWPTLPPVGQAVVVALGLMDLVLAGTLMSPAVQRHFAD